MGEIVGLCVGNYDFLSFKNTFGDLLSIFSKENLTIEEVFDEELQESITRRYFSMNVSKAKMCLDVMGHTISKARSVFEYHKKNYVDNLKDYPDEKIDVDSVEKEYTFENWSKAVVKYSAILAVDTWEEGDYKLLRQCRCENNSMCEKMVLDSLPHWKDDTYFGIDLCYTDEEIGSPWDVLRIILEAFESDEKITLDYTNLFEGGWCDEVPEEKEYSVSKTVILTEGSTDASVISEAMKLLYPHMVKFYSFIDFSTYVVQGSTNYLTHYLKAFIAAGIENRIIALYDNDSAGLSEIESLKRIPIPPNVRIMHLPDLEMCYNYPTIGPAGKSVDNINGRACSIEMFLGKDILKQNGEYEPIRWKSYIDKVAAYQGEIISKSEVLKQFKLKVKRSKEQIILEEWEECDLLLREIFAVFEK
jgi:hypothetical protein